MYLGKDWSVGFMEQYKVVEELDFIDDLKHIVVEVNLQWLRTKKKTVFMCPVCGNEINSHYKDENHKPTIVLTRCPFCRTKMDGVEDAYNKR